MALLTASNYKQNEIEVALKNSNMEGDFLADIEDRIAQLITEDDLNMFD